MTLRKWSWSKNLSACNILIWVFSDSIEGGDFRRQHVWKYFQIPHCFLLIPVFFFFLKSPILEKKFNGYIDRELSRTRPKTFFTIRYQGRIQTTSTYASAEVSSAVVKLLKKYRTTRFLLQIILFFSSADRKDWNVFGQSMPRLFCKICRMSLHACHAVKTVFPGNIRKSSNIQENL